jgi:hypothetical protein
MHVSNRPKLEKNLRTHEPRRTQHTILNASIDKVLPNTAHAVLANGSGGATAQNKALDALLNSHVDEFDHGDPGLVHLRLHHVDGFDLAVLEGFCAAARDVATRVAVLPVPPRRR